MTDMHRAIDALLAFRHGNTKHLTKDHARILFEALSAQQREPGVQVKDILDRRIRLEGCRTYEPSIRQMICDYYDNALGYDPEYAKSCAEAFFAAIIQTSASEAIADVSVDELEAFISSLEPDSMAVARALLSRLRIEPLAASRREAQEPVGYLAPETLTQLQEPNGYGYVVAAPAYTTNIPLYTAPPPAGEVDRLLAEMQPHIDKIERCADANDEWGRVVTGQTDAAREIARIARAALNGGRE